MIDFIILAYHRVLPIELAVERGVISVSTQNFEQQVCYFVKKGWRSITLSELYDEYLAQDRSPRNIFVVTFDDGYRDNYVYGFPILKKYDLKATIFLTVGYLGKERDLFFCDTKRNYEPIEIDYPLSMNEIQEMLSFGIEFGSHTLSHPRLAELDLKQAEYEVVKSKEMLEDYLSRAVISFCYPYGNLNEQVIDMVRNAGYKLGVVTPPCPNIPETIHTLRRTGVYLNDSFLKYRLKCSRLFYKIRETSRWKNLRDSKLLR